MNEIYQINKKLLQNKTDPTYVLQVVHMQLLMHKNKSNFIPLGASKRGKNGGKGISRGNYKP